MRNQPMISSRYLMNLASGRCLPDFPNTGSCGPKSVAQVCSQLLFLSERDGIFRRVESHIFHVVFAGQKWMWSKKICSNVIKLTFSHFPSQTARFRRCFGKASRPSHSRPTLLNDTRMARSWLWSASRWIKSYGVQTATNRSPSALHTTMYVLLMFPLW